MFDSTSFGPRALANPGTLQKAALDEIQSRLSGKYIFADSNNGFSLLAEFGSSCTAAFVRQEDGILSKVYAVRSQTADDLYGHMSDFDYLNIVASPAPLQFKLTLGVEWIRNNAVAYSNDYNLIQVPATTKIVLGGFTFGLYYPINFLVNKNTGTITVLYDLSTPNPLMTPSTNQPYSVTTYTMGGLDLISVVFDAYQFATTVIEKPTDAETGWIYNATYTDQFYAARCFTYINGVWTELAYSLSQMAYDPATPTVLMTILEDIGQIKFEIPQIYFTNGQIGTKIRILQMTTKGAVNTGILASDVNELTVQFDPTSSQYAAPLKQPPILNLIPYNTTILSGGSDALPFETLKARVVNGTLYNNTPITPLQLEAAAQKMGFTLTKYLDNITDRVYYASAPLVTTDGKTVPATVSGILFSTPLLSQVSTIYTFTDNLCTILPATRFLYNQASNTSTPLTDDQVERLKNMSNIDKVTEMNGTLYTQQPYHVVLATSTSPSAKSFNLMNPVQTSLMFDGENVNSEAQLSITNAAITHLNNGTGGYSIAVGVKRSVPIESADPSSFKIIFRAPTRSGSYVIFEAVYVTTDTAAGVDVYTVTIPTNYHISLDGYFQTTVTEVGQVSVINELSLTTAFDVRLMVAQSLYPNVPQMASLTTGVPDTYADYLVVSKQSLTIQFGQDMSNYISNSVDTTWGSQAYATWGEDVYYTYATDQYLKVDGVPVFPLVKIAQAGDNVLQYQQTITPTLTADAAPGSVSILLSTTQGVLVGAPVTGTGIPSGTTVQGVSPTGITLSQGTSGIITEGTLISIYGGLPIMTSVSTAQTAAGNVISVPTTAVNIYKGMSVFGENIPYGTTITSVGINSITLSNATTAPLVVNAVIYIANQTSTPSIQYAKGSVRKDPSGNPILMASRTNVYRVNCLQIDSRLYESEDSSDSAYVATLPNTISSAAMSLDPLRQLLLERTYLYYYPSRTMGTAQFNTGNGAIKSFSLGLSFVINISVTKATKSNTDLCALMQTSAINICSNYVSSNTLINADAMSTAVSKALGSSVISVGVSAIDNIQGLRTFKLVDTGVQASLAYVLDIAADGTRKLRPNVTVNFLEME